MSFDELNTLIEKKSKKIYNLFRCKYAIYPKMEKYHDITIFFTDKKTLDEKQKIQIDITKSLAISQIIEL